jgi:uncharacterized protein YbaR (Trm112 family)
MIDKKLLSILVCPVSKAALEYLPEQQELICWASGLAYPIRDGIPVMLENEARTISLEEKEKRLEEKEKHQAAAKSTH